MILLSVEPKLLPEMREPISLIRIYDRIATLGSIHASKPAPHLP
jgi:hypothetical protein